MNGQTETDSLLVLATMRKTLCRQHIYWPHEGKLPCELDQECAKSDFCQSMAEEVLDFGRRLESGHA